MNLFFFLALFEMQSRVFSLVFVLVSHRSFRKCTSCGHRRSRRCRYWYSSHFIPFCFLAELGRICASLPFREIDLRQRVISKMNSRVLSRPSRSISFLTARTAAHMKFYVYCKMPSRERGDINFLRWGYVPFFVPGALSPKKITKLILVRFLFLRISSVYTFSNEQVNYSSSSRDAYFLFSNQVQKSSCFYLDRST